MIPGWARWVGERIWHENQRSGRAPDGGLILTFQVAGLAPIIQDQWIMPAILRTC